MFKKTVLSISVGIGVLFGSAAMAQSTDNVRAEAASPEVVKNIQNKFTDMNVKGVNYFPELKLYEVRTDQTPMPFYTNDDFTFIFVNGQLVDPVKKVSVTEDRKTFLAAQLFKDLPVDKGFSVKYGNGERQMVVFSDPRCPFCQRMDVDMAQNLKDSDNITVHYLMAPLALPGHEDAPSIASKVLCSDNPGEAWKDWMLNQKMPANDGTCEKSQNVDVSKNEFYRLGFQGTPSIIFDSGVVQVGAMSTPDIRNVLQATKPLK